MAKFQESLGNIGTPVTAKAGIQGPSMAGLIEMAGGALVRGYTEVQGAKLEKGIQAQVDEYMTRKEAPTAMGEAAGQQIAIDKIWGSFDEGVAGVDEMGTVNALEKGVNEKLSKYKAAYEQGVMTSDQLTARINSTVKEAVNRNPGLAHELVNRAKFYQDYTGITDFVRAEAASEKARQADLKHEANKQTDLIYKHGSSAKIMTETGDRGMALREAVFQEEQEQAATRAKQAFQIAKDNQELNTMRVDTIVQDPNFNKIHTSTMNYSSATIQNILQTGQYKQMFPGLDEASAKKMAVQQVFASPINMIDTLLGKASGQTRPQLEGMKKQFTDMQAAYESVASGETTAKLAQAKLTAAQSMAKMPYISAEAWLDYSNKITTVVMNYANASGTNVKPLSDETIQKLIQLEESAFRGGPPVLGVVDLSTKQGQDIAAFTFAIGNPKELFGSDPEQVVKQNSDGISRAIDEVLRIPDKVKFAEATDLFFNHVVKQAKLYKEPITNFLSPESIAKMDNFIGTQLRAEGATMDYDPKTNKVIIMDAKGKVNEKAGLKANRAFQAMMTVHGYDTDERIDKVGMELADSIKKAQGEPTFTEQAAPTPTPVPLATPAKPTVSQSDQSTMRARDALLKAQEKLAVQIAAASESGDMASVLELNDQYTKISEHLIKIGTQTATPAQMPTGSAPAVQPVQMPNSKSSGKWWEE